MPKVTNEKQRKQSKSNKKIKDNEIENNTRDTKDNRFSFDEEIVIGLKRIDEPKIEKRNKRTNKTNKANKTKKGKKGKNNIKNKNAKEYLNNNISISKKSNFYDENDEPTIIRSKYLSNYENEDENYVNTYYDKNRSNVKKDAKKAKSLKSSNSVKNKELSKKRRKVILKLVKIFTLFCIIIGGIIFAMFSPMFNIESIVVNGNSKISSETIVSLSGLSLDQNIFRFSIGNIKEAIKQNAYIDTVEVYRKFPNKIEIDVKERNATYELTYGNAYVYINNQGYILEITSKKGDFPILTGYETPSEQIIEGNRLNTEDLGKLNDVLKIMEAISSGGNKVIDLITSIDISNSTNYILTLDKEKKTIYLGDTSNLSTKVLWINRLLEEEKKNEGTMYLNINLNTDLPYFREKV